MNELQHTHLKSILDTLNINSCVNMSLVMSAGEIRTKKKLQHLFNLKFKDTLQQQIYELILSYIAAAEQKCACAGLLLIDMLLGRNSVWDSPDLRSKDDVYSAMHALGINKKLINLMSEVFDLASLDTKISIKKAVSNNFHIELFEGHLFSVVPLLKDTIHKEYLKTDILCIDGYIESVSEIHYLLEQYSKSSKTILLFCRGLSDDVLNTLAVNLQRKTVSVLPFKVPFDIDNVNTLVDIATICRGDVISTTKGDLISSYERYVMHTEKVSIQKDSVLFVPDHTTNVSRDNLLSKVEDRPEIAEVLMKRVSTLTARQITIAVPDDLNYFSNVQQLDLAIRLFSSLSSGLQPLSVAKEYYANLVATLEQTSLSNNDMCY